MFRKLFIPIICKIIGYDRFHISEGIGANKTSGSKECIICHSWYFLNKSFKFQQTVWNGWHDVFMMSIEINSIVF